MSELGLDAAVTVATGDAELAIAFDSRRGVVELHGPNAGRVHAARLAGISAPISAPRRIFSTDLSRYTSHRHSRFSGMM